MHLTLNNIYMLSAMFARVTKSRQPAAVIADRVVGFYEFTVEYSRNYETFGELVKSFGTFWDNMDVIDAHNAEENEWTMGVTNFADMTAEEFEEVYKKGGYDASGLGLLSTSCSKYTPVSTVLPDTIDWREMGAVTDVKNQGQCGSCWSFSATGAMEGAWAVSNSDLVSLSEQQLVDCSKRYGNNGCNGGLMEAAFSYAADHGMCSEDAIPYTATDKADCQKCSPVAKFSDCVSVTSGNQLHLKEAVSRGPVSIAIEADTLTFQHYTGGVLNSDRCGTNLDHGVLIVGYGTDDASGDYWTVKNSWGDGWGEDGYIRIARSDSESDNGICGIAMQPAYPIV
jgi:C1A family cysteine protease